MAISLRPIFKAVEASPLRLSEIHRHQVYRLERPRRRHFLRRLQRTLRARLSL